MPEATGGGLTTQVSLLALQGWRWLVVDGTAAAAETAANGALTAKAFYTLGTAAVESVKQHRAEGDRQIKLTFITAAALVAASIAISYK